MNLLKSEYKESEEKYSLFFSLSIDLLCIANFDGYFKYLNPVWTKTLGWSTQELIAKPFIEFVHLEDRESTILAAQKLTESVDSICFENRYLCRDGSYKWLSWNATGLSEEKLIYAVARDITLNKESEIVLQQSIRELEAFKFALNAHSLVAITDKTGRITYVNDQFCEISKYSREELLGQDHRIINSGYHTKEFFANLWKTIAQGEIWKGEIKNKAKDGTFYWVDTLIAPILNSDGKYYQYVAIRTDITQRKLSELALLERSRLSLLSAEVSLGLSQSGTLTEILQNCTNTISQYLDIGFICIWTFEQQTNHLQLQAGVHCTDVTCSALSDTRDYPNHMVLVNNIIGLMIQNHQAVFNEELSINNSDKLLDSAFSIFRFSAYPLIVEQQLIGIMALFSKQLFTEPTHNLLNWIANNIAVAIDRIWAREELLSRREALLLRLASQIRSSLNLDIILETAVNEIRSLLQIDRCYFLCYLPHPSQPSLTVTYEARNPNLPTMLGSIPVQKSTFLTKILLSQELSCIDDINSKSYLDYDMQELLTDFGITSQLLLPVKSNSGEIAAIVCSHCSGDRIWSNSEIKLLQAVCDQLAIAIDHAQLYTQSRSDTLVAQTQAEKLTETLHKLQQTQSQLIQNEKMSSLGQLVAGVAHEINNPVNFIHGNLTYAKEYFQEMLTLLHLYQQYYPQPQAEIEDFAERIDLEFITDDLYQLLNSMNMGTNRIREIVLGLRNFSRHDEADKKQVDIHEGIENTLLILHHRWKNNGIGLDISIVKEYGDLPLVDCYPGQLNQVFMNILTNAIDALEESIVNIKTTNQPQISISTKVLDSKFVVIRIADNGLGMTEDVRKRLFDPFFTTKPVGKGTGLGLSISYQIVVERHGGILNCLSEPGKGTEFWIKIPI
ncbi:PAS domain S-box protein [Scytonema hofmannii FACHB-248]|uniref:histidine kinase n=1 Tax=Scytonema hofmannii FACHB-248 TaxID=1842502 RepID=A0ABR8GRF6_9CYAN|nr:MULTISPECIES: PAS domain S-box protein [Nostocales]MBD2605996.1 PAS domain S-box protein [Scytonema hofmannii FACHB-248]